MRDLTEESWHISGRVVSGVGQGAGFTQLAWAMEQFIAECGISPYPGTLNIVLTDDHDLATWQKVKADRGIRIHAGDSESCDCRLFPVRIGNEFPGAIVLPEVSGYPGDQVELIASLPLRRKLSVADGDRIEMTGQCFASVKTIIFDVDGTLLNSLDGYRAAAHRAAAAHGYEVTLDTVRRALNSNQPFWELVVPAEKAADPAFIRQLRTETMAHWPAAMAEHVSVLPGAEPAFRQLRDAGIHLAIFTGSDGESLSVLEDAGLLEYFDPILTGRDVGNRKPEPDGILQCLEIMSADPVETIYIGDSVTDVRASQAAGVGSISMLTGAGDSASLSAAGTHRVLASLAGLPGLFL